MRTLAIALIIILGGNSLSAQVEIRNQIVRNSDMKSSTYVPVSEAYLSDFKIPASECVSDEMQKQVWEQVQKNIALLRKKNPNMGRSAGVGHTYFAWPTQAKQGFTDYGYYTVNFLVDHNTTPNNNLLDYNCGNRTYDWGSGNHQGTDIILWPYAWRRMDDQVMEVVAAAPGVIVNKVDGNFDRNCVNAGAGAWNAIHIQHEDGSIAWYLHFKSGSLTTKILGDSVVTGEYLGTAGSSGSSSWPHLHFQVQDSSGNLIDPYDGSCNSLNAGDSWWLSQDPYNVPSVNRICTKGTVVDYYNCPTPEITYEQTSFDIGDSLWLWVYTRDLELNSNMQLNIYNPSMVNSLNWSFTVPWATTATAFVRWYYLVDSWWTPGWWTFESVYGGNTYQTQFYITGTAAGIADHANATVINVTPNPVSDLLTIKEEKLKGIVQLRVVDISGRIVLSAEQFTDDGVLQMDIKKLNGGAYMLQIVNGDTRFHSRILKL